MVMLLFLPSPSHNPSKYGVRILDISCLFHLIIEDLYPLAQCLKYLDLFRKSFTEISTYSPFFIFPN